MSRLFIVGIDVDNGMPGAEIDRIISERGLFAIRYTTHSHGRDVTEVRKDDLVRFQRDNPGAGVQEYLATKKGYLSPILDSIAATDEAMTANGLVMRVTHAPMDKNRVIFVLARPWAVTDYPTQDEARKAWKSAYKAFAAWLGIEVDESCSEVARLFYLPRHAEGAPFETKVHEGRAVDIFALPTSGGANPYLDAAKGMGAATGEGETYQTLRRWAGAGFANAFLMGDFLAECAPDRLRSEFDRDAAKRHIECPYADEHTDPTKGGGTFVMNAGDGNTSAGFVVKCMHGHCADRDRLHFVEGMLRDGWFTLADMADPRWYLDVEGLEFGDLRATLLGETVLDRLTEGFDGGTALESGDGITLDYGRAALADLVRRGADDFEAIALCQTLAEKGKRLGLTKTDWRRLYRQIKDEAKATTRASDKKANSDTRPTVFVDADFREAVGKVLSVLVEGNTPPRLFKFNSTLSRVERLDRDQLSIRPLDDRKLRRESSQVVRWLKPSDGDDFREVAPPMDVI
ncbi:hypothetical protein [Roseomonas genomospecies 6]|uniref:Uncharacterized protein n=1 Tax=Roseomonas genomospecies 6 TaxID=214106 RepID=A0A9W7NED8_9PROT|nr:hypothetical protein [Roseomonas genomospecies 6]KAA0677286.1 hypothetical protein DS843_24365 [Roseomonas genomospecies 6]